MVKKLERFQGDTYPIIYELSINDEPANLSDATSIEFAYAKRGAEATVISGTIDADRPNFVIFEISEDDFSELGDYNFDIQVKYGDLSKRTFIKDKISILEGVNNG